MLKALPWKKNKYVNGIIKGILVILFLWVIYRQMSAKEDLTSQWQSFSSLSFNENLPYLIISLLLLPFNILLESLKWKVMVNRFEDHSIKKSIFSVFSGISAGLITPARIGDYIGKLMFISPANNWKAVWSNLTGSIAQNMAIIGGGIMGTLYFFFFNLELDPALIKGFLLSGSLIVLLLIIIYFNLHWIPDILSRLKGHPIITKIKKSLAVVYHFDLKTLLKVLLLAVLRYSIFTLQYYFLFRFWGIEGGWIILMASIMFIFLIQSAIPLPPVLNVLARGEVALLVISTISSNQMAILSAAFSIWIINLGIPALIGLIIMLNINITKTMGYD